jgi:hypothetical protein
MILWKIRRTIREATAAFHGLFCSRGYHRWDLCVDGYVCRDCGLLASWDEIFDELDEMEEEEKKNGST